MSHLPIPMLSAAQSRGETSRALSGSGPAAVVLEVSVALEWHRLLVLNRSVVDQVQRRRPKSARAEIPIDLSPEVESLDILRAGYRSPGLYESQRGETVLERAQGLRPGCRWRAIRLRHQLRQIRSPLRRGCRLAGGAASPSRADSHEVSRILRRRLRPHTARGV